MSWFVFVYCVLFLLHFISNESDGKITSPPDGTNITILPGGSDSIIWSFDDDVSTVTFRTWSFTSTDGLRSETLGVVPLNLAPALQSGILPGISITKPATLGLNNAVNQSYDGTYTFTLTTTATFTSSVRVFIAKKPNVTLNCSSVTLNEGGDFTCECKGLGGNPPANVTWYKDDNQIGETGTEKQLLTVINVDETDSGTYKCMAESYPHAPLYRDEKSIKINVRFEPKDTSIELKPNPATLGQSFAITCSSRGFPEPSYKISHNGSYLINTTKSHTTDNVEWTDSGVYECNAENGLGNNKVSKFLKVTEREEITTTQEPSIPNTSEKSIPNGSGRITSPPDGTKYVFLPGETAKIKWEFDDFIFNVEFRSWSFVNSDGSLREVLASISRNDLTNIQARLLDVDIERPSTLVLKNVNQSYNGVYRFSLTLAGIKGGLSVASRVTVYIAKKPTVTLNCSNVTLNEGDDFICECKGEGGNPPANVTWYKDGNQIQGKAGTERQLLTLTKVNKTDSGTYKCEAESYPDPLYKDEKSITVNVRFRSKDTYIELNPNPAPLGQSFTITCSSRGLPEPTYKIFHNGSHLIDAKTYIINNVGWPHAGKYECNAENGFGPTNKASKFLNVTGRRPITQKLSIPNTSKKDIPIGSGNGCDSSGTVVVWHIVVALLSGIIIGILFSYLVFYSHRRWCKNRKPERTSEPQMDGVDTTYQELDLTKMNTEDNYQSLRGNVAVRASNDVANDEQSTYTQLSKIRDVEDNYQSLT